MDEVVIFSSAVEVSIPNHLVILGIAGPKTKKSTHQRSLKFSELVKF